MSKTACKALWGTNHILTVVDYQKGHFVVVRRSDGQQSPIYTDKMGKEYLNAAYMTFHDAYETNPRIFAHLCEQSLQC